MLVPPSPIGLLVALMEPVERAVPTVVLLYIDTISTILVVIPMMVIVVVSVMVNTIMIIGSQRGRSQCHRHYQLKVSK
jgi:hypothetical protein